MIAPGGGWIRRPGLLAVLGEETLSVWLRASPAETVRRLRTDDVERPFRGHPDPTALIAEMLLKREPLYSLADLALWTDGRRPEDMAFEIECAVRASAERR